MDGAERRGLGGLRPVAHKVHWTIAEMSDVHKPGLMWRTSHMAHAATFLGLLATGLLLFSPTIRSRLIGGYALQVRSIHCWVGVAFAVATVPFLRPVLRPWRCSARGGAAAVAPWRWRYAHLLFTVAAGVTFTASGLLLWQQHRFGLALADASAWVHLWLTYLAAGVLTVHLAIATITPRVRVARERVRIAVAAFQTHEHAQ